MMLFYFIRTFAEYLFDTRKGSVVAWRSTLAPFSFRFSRGREHSFVTVWSWFRTTMGVILNNRSVPLAPATEHLAIEDVPGDGEGRRRYVEERLGRPCEFIALNDLTPSSFAQRIGLLVQVAGLYLFLMPFILFGGRRRASMGLIPVDFVRLCLLVRTLKGCPVRDITWFYGYEKGTALMILCLLDRCGVRVRIVPSPNPIRNFYTHVVASTFVFTMPYQEEEALALQAGWWVKDTMHWPMYRTDKIRLTSGRATVPTTVGFVSSGNWLRRQIGKNQIGAHFDKSEEQVLSWCMTFARSRPDVSMRIFLHPLERRPEHVGMSREHFGRWGFAPQDIMTDVAMGQHPELMDVGVSLYSSALLERMHAGYKGVFAQPGMPENYFLGAINNVVARDEAGFHALLDDALALGPAEFFERHGICNYGGFHGQGA